MSKQSIKLVSTLIIGIIMLGIFKSFMGGGTSNEQLQNAISNGAKLIDVRTPSEFTSGSVKGAINIPLDQIPLKMNKLNKNDEFIVFCRSGSRSSQAKSILESNGFRNVINGGTWQNVNQALNK